MQYRDSTEYTQLDHDASSLHPTATESSSKRKMWRFSWNKGVEMIALLITGIAGALGHLFFYRHLLGGPVDGPFLLSQEWNIRIGTSLAFLSKTCWTVAVLVAQAQHVWTTLDKKELDVATIDAMILAPSDITYLVQGHRLRHAKVATLLALAAWTIPLSAIITPATLTVERKLFLSDSVDMVSMIDFNNVTNFASVFLCIANAVTTCPESQNPNHLNPAVLFSSPNTQTMMPVVIASSTGQIYAMEPRTQNMSYHITFNGPTIHCSQPEPDLASTIYRIDTTVNVPLSKSRTDYEDNLKSVRFGYNAFIPAKSENGTTTALDWAQMNMEMGAAESMIPEAAELWIRYSSNGTSDYHVCALYNATYDTTFTFENKRQYTNYTVQLLDKMKWEPALLGNEEIMYSGNRNFGIDGSENPQKYTYQAIFMALARQLVGRFMFVPLNTNVAQTSIMGSKEFQGKTSGSYNTRNKTIPEMIEELSQNVTLSFFSSPRHLSPTGVQTMIHGSESRNVYNVNQQTLLLSYGIALLVASAAVVVGLMAYRVNGGSRSMTYSAIVQAAKDDKLKYSTSIT